MSMACLLKGLCERQGGGPDQEALRRARHLQADGEINAAGRTLFVVNAPFVGLTRGVAWIQQVLLRCRIPVICVLINIAGLLSQSLYTFLLFGLYPLMGIAIQYRYGKRQGRFRLTFAYAL